jgi:hypothetical protein
MADTLTTEKLPQFKPIPVVRHTFRNRPFVRLVGAFFASSFNFVSICLGSSI